MNEFNNEFLNKSVRPPDSEHEALSAINRKDRTFLESKGYTGRLSPQGFLELRTGGFSLVKPSDLEKDVL